MYSFRKRKMDKTTEHNNTITAVDDTAVRSIETQSKSISQMKATIVCKEDDYKKITEYSLMDDNERGCFLIGGVSRYENNIEIYVNKVYIPPEQAYKSRDKGGICIDAEYMLKVYDDYVFTDAQAIVTVHSHPFASESIEFSHRDFEVFDKTTSHCIRRKKGVHASLVLGRDGIFAGMFATSLCDLNKDVSLKIIGKNGIVRLPEPEVTLEVNRLDRQLPIFGELGQKKIANTKLAVIGVGGVGSHFTVMSVYHGIGNIMIIDADVIEESNLNRLAGAGWKDVGQKKVDVVKKAFENISNCVTCKSIPMIVQEAMNEFKEADIVASCVDTDESRLWLQEFCARHYKPLIDFGAGGTCQ